MRYCDVQFAPSGHVYSLLRGLPGDRGGTPTLLASEGANGEVIWDAPVEEAAWHLVGEADDVVLVTGSSGLILGLDARTGGRLFRTRLGAINQVVSRPDGILTVFDEAGAIHRVRVVRR